MNLSGVGKALLYVKPKIKVLVVDDSALMRELLTHCINGHPQLMVVGQAAEAFEARTLIKKLQPDVITLDIEMPKMNGLVFLQNLMRLHPLPVIMVSTLTARGASVTTEALTLGAVDFVKKPHDIDNQLSQFSGQLNHKLLAASMVCKDALRAAQTRCHGSHQLSVINNMADNTDNNTVNNTVLENDQDKAQQLILIGGSTGGLEAVKHILTHYSFRGDECVVICLHLPGDFTRSYAHRLNTLLPITVKQAQHGEQLKQGHAYIAPGTQHLRLCKTGDGWITELDSSEKVSGHRPSVDVLFASVARQQASDKHCALLLTGMGKDGAQGLLALRQSGTITVAQDEASSIVWGMPQAAIKSAAAAHVLPLTEMPNMLGSYCLSSKPQRAKR